MIADVRMPPTHTDEGMRAGVAAASALAAHRVLVLSQYVEERYATELLAGDAAGVGYLLKERVADVREFVDDRRRVARRRHRCSTPKSSPSSSPAAAAAASRLPRSRRETRGAAAHGRGPFRTRAIAQALVVSAGAVEKHVNNIFTKLALAPAASDHRRVLAVLHYLEGNP